MSKNHYVSQLIIKRFGPSVNTFDLRNHTVIENRQAAKMFFEKDIYADEIEKKMAHDLEQPFALLLDQKILNRDEIRLTRDELFLLKRFLLLDCVKTYSAEHFSKIIHAFSDNTKRYMSLGTDPFLSQLKGMPTTASLGLSPHDLHMRAMRLYMEFTIPEDLAYHPLATQELYCWAKVIVDGYIVFWDSHENHEFILSSTGMISEYESCHSMFEGMDLEKHAYLLDRIKRKKTDPGVFGVYAHTLALNQLMYENVNIFNLSSTRCMALLHPFFKLYNETPFYNVKGFEKPDIWPTLFETRQITRQPVVRYLRPNDMCMKDVFVYEPVRLSEWDTVYVNHLVLHQTQKMIGFCHVEKILDSLCCVNLFDSFNDSELLDSLRGIDALERWIENLLHDQYNYIFSHYQSLDLECRMDIIAYVDRYWRVSVANVMENRYLLESLLSDEKALRDTPNFHPLGPPDKRVGVVRRNLERLKNSK